MALSGLQIARAGEQSPPVETYYQCLSALAWATPLSGERMVRHNVFQKATVDGQSLYVLSSSQYPPSFENRCWIFGPRGAVSTELGSAPREWSDNRYLPETHYYLDLLVPGIPTEVVADLSTARAWTGLDTFLKAYARDSLEGSAFADARALKPLAVKPAAADAALALKNETLLALAEVAKTPLSALEKAGPEEYRAHPYEKSIFDRCTQALAACAPLSDAEIQAAIGRAQERVAAETALYLQKHPVHKLTTFEKVLCRLGLEDL